LVKTLTDAGGIDQLSTAHAARQGNTYLPLLEIFYKRPRSALFILRDTSSWSRPARITVMLDAA
jgi:hypothetical protein